MVFNHAAGWALGSMLCLALAGCGEGRRSAKVSGVVTLDGQPASDIGVMFQPLDTTATKEPMAVTSAGATDAEGRFELRFSDTNAPGAIVGKHTVRFADRLAVPAQSSDAGPSPSAPKSRLPARYIDGAIEFEVLPEGTTEAKFDLLSK